MQYKSSILSDSLGMKNSEKDYLLQLIRIYQNEKERLLSEKLNAYDMQDEFRQSPICINSLFSQENKTLVVRYTEIGCNSCADSTFKMIRKNKSSLNDYEVLVLVDFSKYEYYLKWAKISEIDEKVFWLKKGSLPFHIENESSSYLFVVDQKGTASSFFIPNSNFAGYLKDYINGL